MLLAIEVGNTHTVVGALQADGAVAHRWRISTLARTTDELGLLLLDLLRHQGLTARQFRGACVCCVEPSVLYTVENACRRYLGLEPLVVGSGVKTGLRIRTDNPREIGSDRIVNAVAALEGRGGPLVIVRFGAATTFDCISGRGDYVGGAIAPGFEVSAGALFSQAAKLPTVEVERTDRVIGTNTADAMKAGMFWGYVGLTDELIRRCKAELGAEEGGAVRCVATGRLARLIGPACGEIDEIDDVLTLRGLHLIHRRNQPRRGRR